MVNGLENILCVEVENEVIYKSKDYIENNKEEEKKNDKRL